MTASSSKSPTAPVVQAIDLTVRMGRTNAISGLNMEIPRGAIFALVGPNGAGKTTFIKTLLNLRKPVAGTASVLGTPSTAIAGHALERIGYVSENQELPGWITLESMLAYLCPFYPQWDRELEQQLLTQFRLAPGKKLKHMSRGEQMKAALLAALAYRPPLLILDEPFSGLDPLARDEFIEGLLDSIATQTDVPPTIVLSSHDLAEIESFATHIAYLEEGRLLFAEEISSLTGRFREVTVVLDENSLHNTAWKSKAVPASWILPEYGSSFFRFINTRAGDSPEAQIASLLSHAKSIQSEPMSLRSIFVALARSSRTEPAARSERSRI